MKIGEGWKSKKNALYKKVEGDGTKTVDEFIASLPSEAPDTAMWERLVRYRRSTEGRVSKQFLNNN